MQARARQGAAGGWTSLLHSSQHAKCIGIWFRQGGSRPWRGPLRRPGRHQHGRLAKRWRPAIDTASAERIPQTPKPQQHRAADWAPRPRRPVLRPWSVAPEM